jgi:putative colanic acid biosynthesis acetyltransferase WcaF
MELNIKSNRATANYTRTEMARRFFWVFGHWLFWLSPRPCFGWRRFVLRCFGAKIGAHVNTYNSTRVYFPWNLSVGEWSAIGENVLIYNLGRVAIGRKVTISHGAHLCAGTHDYRKLNLPLLKIPIEVHDQAWICADAFIGPGMVIGEGSVVAARAVVTKNVEPWTVSAGNPARFIKKRELSSISES